MRWAETVRAFDGFVFVTPEYHHSIPASLKNAIDYLYAEWNDKPAGFVSHGLDGGLTKVLDELITRSRALQQLREQSSEPAPAAA